MFARMCKSVWSAAGKTEQRGERSGRTGGLTEGRADERTDGCAVRTRARAEDEVVFHDLTEKRAPLHMTKTETLKTIEFGKAKPC